MGDHVTCQLFINPTLLQLPPRPPGQRTEPEPHPASNFPGFGFGDGGFHMSFGIGAFPFGFFASTFNFGDGRPGAPRKFFTISKSFCQFLAFAAPVSPDHPEDQFLSKAFLWVAILFIFWLLIA